jgi:hypothetical protein
VETVAVGTGAGSSTKGGAVGTAAGAQEAVNSTATSPKAWKKKRGFIKVSSSLNYRHEAKTTLFPIALQFLIQRLCWKYDKYCLYCIFII